MGKYRRRFFIFSLFLLLISELAFSITQDAYQLFFIYKDGNLSYEGFKNVYVPRKYFNRNSGDWLVEFSDSEDNLAYKAYIRDPRIVFYDESLPDNSLKGKMEIMNEATFSIYIPKINDIRNARVLKIYSEEKTAGNDLSGIARRACIGETKIDMNYPYITQEKQDSSGKLISVTKIVDNGAFEDRINIVFVPTFCPEEEIPIFHDIVTCTLNTFFPWRFGSAPPLIYKTPFKEYFKLFNIYRADISDLEFTNYSDFNSVYNGYLADQLPGRPDVIVYIRGEPIMGNHYWCFNCDSLGGGICYGDTIALCQASGGLLAHELGHTFGLGDEYVSMYGQNCADDPPAQEITTPNQTIYTTKGNIKWNLWIDDSTPLPTPDVDWWTQWDYPIIGAFKGAFYECFYYRPKFSCCMRADPVPFCEICREALSINWLVNYVDMIKSESSCLSLSPSGSLLANYSITLDDILFGQMESPKIYWYCQDEHLSQYDNQTSISIESSFFANHPQKISVNIIGSFKGTEGFIRKSYTASGYKFDFPALSKGTV